MSQKSDARTGSGGELQSDYGTSWSQSRFNPACWRKVWFEGLGAWGGWKENSPTQIRRAYTLKQLEGRYGWAGNLAHESISYYLRELRGSEERGKHRATRIVSLEEMLNRAYDQFIRQIAAAKSNADNNARSFHKDPKNKKTFFEIYYGENDGYNEWNLMWGIIENSLRVFDTEFSPRIREIPPTDWLAVEPGHGGKGDLIPTFQFPVDGIQVKIYCIPDFAYRKKMKDSGAKVVIIDWKTGKRDESRGKKHDVQQATYALFAEQQYGVRLADVELRTVYLNIDVPTRAERIKVTDFAQVDIEPTRAVIESAIKEYRARFEDPDNDIAQEENFPCTDKKSECRFCNFRAMCPGAPETYQIKTASNADDSI